MRHATRRFAALVVMLSAVSACKSLATKSERQVNPATTVRVENQGFVDMTIYVIQSSQRVRLGIVNGNTTQVLRIPSSLISGMTQLQFLADPIGGSRAPISDQITVSPGDQVTLMIPPS